MNFLEARKLVRDFSGNYTLSCKIYSSINLGDLPLYLRAFSTYHRVALQTECTEYDTLRQSLDTVTPQQSSGIFILLPWDVVSGIDWRKGHAYTDASSLPFFEFDNELFSRISKLNPLGKFFLPAPFLPPSLDPSVVHRISSKLIQLASEAGFKLLEPSAFSLSTYFATGCPFDGSSVSSIAETICTSILIHPPSFKVLATDADNTLWQGIVGEDGPLGVSAFPAGSSYKHFVYQSLLKLLKSSGILLAIISRNETKPVVDALLLGGMLLQPSDFVSIQCSYGDKSQLLLELSDKLNLSLSSIVFVDDSPIELKEVATVLTERQCIQFPAKESHLIEFLANISNFFLRERLTNEDLNRSDMYRRMSTLPKASSSSFSDYIQSLEMKMTFYKRDRKNLDRVLQLINKTNQFNLNGVRQTLASLLSIIDSGGHIFSASLSDKTGTYGEVIAIVIDSNYKVLSFVMSCRVFKRDFETAFLSYTLRHLKTNTLLFDYHPTESNLPFQNFTDHPSFIFSGDTLILDVDAFLQSTKSATDLFSVSDNV